jgi:hypothetical protein
MSSELMRVETDDGDEALFEVDLNPRGMQDVSFDGKIVKARQTLEHSLAEVRNVAVKALDTFRGGDAGGPDGIELEFGVKFKAEAGTAVFAKAAAEGHIIVRLSWSGTTGGGEADDE